jgi:hypothetical protein
MSKLQGVEEGNHMENSTLIENWNGPVEVVEPEVLGSCTRNGWKILAVIQDDHLEEVTDQEVNPHKDQNGYNYSTTTIPTQRHHKCRRTRFLIGQTGESALSEQILATDVLATKLFQANALLKEATADRTKTENARGAAQRGAEDARKSLEEARRQLHEEQERRRLLEGDMAKVRQAVGDLRWREILDPPK